MPALLEVTFTAALWEHHGQGAWHFVTLPEDLSDDIEAATGAVERGFGSVRVEVTVGSSTWRTSVFPDKGRGAYVLPMKRLIRSAEGITAGDEVEVHLLIEPED